MSLLVLPLNDLADREDPLARTLLEVSALHGVEHASRVADPNLALLQEPLEIALLFQDPFDDLSLSGPAGSCILRVGQPPGMVPPGKPSDRKKLDDPERERQELLFQRIGRLLQRPGELAHLVERQGSPPFLLIVPVLHIRDFQTPEETSEKAAGLLDRLSRLWQTLGSLVPRLTQGGIGGDAHLASGDVLLLPWVFWEPKFPANRAQPLFQGPEGLGRDRLTPLVYADVAQDGTPHPFAGYGQTRLLTDLLLLNALSADRDRFREVFPEPGSQDRRVFFHAHSTLFEYPFNDTIRGAVLHLLEGEDSLTRMVPSVDRLEGLSREVRGEYQDRVRTHLGVLEEVLNHPEFEPHALAFPEPGQEASREAEALPRGAREVRFEILPRKGIHEALSANRMAETLHDQWLAVIRDATGPFLDRILEQGLQHAFRTIAEQTEELQKCLVEALGPVNRHPETRPEIPDTARAVGRLIGTLDMMESGLRDMGQRQREEKIEDPKDLEQAAIALRDDWVDSEERLIQEAATLPGRGATLLHGLGTAIAVLGIAFFLKRFSDVLRDIPSWVTWTTALAWAVLSAGLVYWFARSRTLGWVERCRTWTGEARAQANLLMERLVRILNTRIRRIKFATSEDLRRSMRAVRERLRTEIAGLGSLIRDELASRTRQKAAWEQMERQFPPVAAGRFRFAFPDSVRANLDKSLFLANLSRLLEPVVRLKEMPGVITLEEFRALIGGAVQEAVSSAEDSVRENREQGNRLLREAVRWGSDRRLLSPGGNELAAYTYLMGGSLLQERLDLDEAIPAGAARVGGPASVALPRELAITVTVLRVAENDDAASGATGTREGRL